MWLSGCGYNDHTDSPTPLSQNWQLCNLKMWSFVGSNLMYLYYYSLDTGEYRRVCWLSIHTSSSGTSVNMANQ